MNNQYHRVRLFGALAIGFAAAGAPLMPAAARERPAPKISMGEARAIALKAFPAKIIKSELERERGGSGLRYSCDMRQGKTWREVGVDAMTGRVLENSPEGANPAD